MKQPETVTSVTGNAGNSGKKPGTFQPGEDPRRGKGPKKGARGAGRPVAALRAALRDRYEGNALDFVNSVLEGAVMVQHSMPIREVLDHVTCPDCGGKNLRLKKGAKRNVLIHGLTSASIRDRQAAAEHFAKYGMGTTITPTDGAGNALIDELLGDVDPLETVEDDLADTGEE